MNFRILLGTLLIIAAVGALMALVFVPLLPGMTDNPTLLNLMASLVCEPGERATMQIIVTHDSDGTSYSPDVTCIGREGERTNASGKLFLIGAGVFTVPFLIGLFLVIFNPRAFRREVQDTIQIGQDVVGVMKDIRTGVVTTSRSTSAHSGSPHIGVKDGVLKVGSIEIRMDGIQPDQAQILEGLSPDFFQPSGAGSSLASKLKELQEALDAGLISRTEYDQLRKEVLDKLV
jgi:hypothetical protein